MIPLDRTRVCLECRGVLPADRDDPAAAGFYVNRRLVGGQIVWAARCRECMSRARRERRRTDLVFAERERGWRDKWVDRNPEKNAQIRRDWQARYRKLHREEVRAYQRMGYRLRRERAGLPVREARLSKVIDGTRPERPSGPFSEWLAAYKRARGLSIPELAEQLGLVERRVRSLLSGEQASVSVDVVSRALTEARIVVAVDGRAIVTFDDLYGEEPLRERRRKR